MWLGVLSFILFLNLVTSILLPHESPTRSIKELNGLWNFRLSHHYDPDAGFREKWFDKPLSMTGEVIAMPVPSSYNDVTGNGTIRDHIGWVWYDRTFYLPSSWIQSTNRIVLRFGGAHYSTIVFVNGEEVLNHTGGHLPFEAEVRHGLFSEDKNLITVAINNTLTMDTVPQGRTVYPDDDTKYPPKYYYQEIFFDFFNYAGIHRPVVIYTTPNTYIEDVNIRTTLAGKNAGMIHYAVEFGGDLSNDKLLCQVSLFDKNGKNVIDMNGCFGDIYVQNANLWWPFTMRKEAGYLYDLQIKLLNRKKLIDTYNLAVGIREVLWNNKTLKINGEPFYFAGFGMHEDSDIRGKGVDLPLIIRNYNMINFLHGNSFRTSHYPYADEIMDEADRRGIVVIEEAPAVALQSFGHKLLGQHLQTIREMIARDKNRPSVVMWSLANEPRSALAGSTDYFRKISAFARSLDSTRPITAVLNAKLKKDNAAQFLDIICVNRYFAWYSDTGHTELIQRQVINEYTAWHLKHNKPVMISEYGAGSVAGLHRTPPMVFTEDYQAQLLMQYHQGFDILRKKGFFIGELVWNFADFMTTQKSNRVDGNKKGLLTRDRQPKMAAYVIRKRYYKLAQENFNFSCDVNKISNENDIYNHLEL